MVRIAPIGLQYNPKTLWFDPAGHDVKRGDAVVVRTERGTEFGHAVDDVMEVDEAAVKKLKSALKPVLRIADEKDIEQAAEMEALGREALPVFKKFAAETNEDMRPVMVEYLFDGDKAVFYFSAEDRVDFRELVRKLAAHFHVRVDMRQIGVRDEARIVGGLGHCGQELCCKRLGGEFCPVSIRMAKEQDLSLNPSKISGVCGRLMCCLRYEFEAYKDFKSRAPKAGSTVITPDGPAKVCELDVPREIVSLKMEDGKVVKVPLADFEPAEEGARPNEVGEEAFRRNSEPDIALNAGAALVTFSTPHFTGKDKLSEGGVRVTGRKASKKSDPRRPAKDAKQAEPRRQRRRRSGSDAVEEASKQQKQQGKQRRSKQGAAAQQQKQQGGQQKQKQQSAKAPRPGQNSSALRNGGSSGQQQRRRRNAKPEAGQQQGQQARAAASGTAPKRQKQGSDAHRTSRRRTHRTTGGAASKGSGEGTKPQASGSGE